MFDVPCTCPTSWQHQSLLVFGHSLEIGAKPPMVTKIVLRIHSYDYEKIEDSILVYNLVLKECFLKSNNKP